MKDSPKADILRILAEDGPLEDSAILTARLQKAGWSFDRHETVHKAWDLQKQGLVQFIERSNGGRKDLTGIAITPRGERVVEGMEVEVSTMTTPRIADRIEEVMATGGDRGWSPKQLAGAVALDVRFPEQTISSTLKRDQRFARIGPGQWTLRNRQRVEDRGRADHEQLRQAGVPVAVIPSNGRDSEPVTAVPQPQGRPDLLAGLALVTALVERAEKRAQLAEAARILEAAGEDELAIQTLSRVELDAFETEVVELVRRVRGEAANPSGAVHAGDR